MTFSLIHTCDKESVLFILSSLVKSSYFFPGSSIRKIIRCWSVKYKSEDLGIRIIACHLSWVLCSCKHPSQHMQLCGPAVPANFSSSISLKKCHRLLWSSCLSKNRVLCNLNKVTLCNCLLPIAKCREGSLCSPNCGVSCAFHWLLGVSLLHWGLASYQRRHRFHPPAWVLIPQNSPGVPRQGSSVGLLLFVCLFLFLPQVAEEKSWVYLLGRRQGNKLLFSILKPCDGSQILFFPGSLGCTAGW